jgi:hypothetical protein
MPRLPPTFRRVARTVLACACCAAAWRAANASAIPLRSAAHPPDGLPRLTYIKVLKGSVPEYMSITVDEQGSGTYDGRKLADPPSPRPLKLSSGTTEKLFDLAGQLHHFQSIGLESHKKVANLGMKTLIYEASGQKNRVDFNYTLNRGAQELTELFEKIGAVELHIQDLEYAIKYDHLGLPQELMQIQIDLENKALADPELMVPTLDEIARNPRFLHLAQVRAQNILERLQNDR